LINKYDDNQDGVMQWDEFKGLIKDLEPGISDDYILLLFKEALNSSEMSEISDAIAQDAFN